MGRRTLNQYAEIQIEKTEKTFKMYNVKLPFPVNVAYRPKNSKNNIGFLVKNVMAFYSDKDQIIKRFDELGFEIGDIQQLTMRQSELCPQCNRHGIPKVERKDTTDYHVRSGRYDESKIRLKKRKDEWWLTFDHKTKPRKCRIKQYQGNFSNTFKPNKFKKIDSRKLLFENVINFLR